QNDDNLFTNYFTGYPISILPFRCLLDTYGVLLRGIQIKRRSRTRLIRAFLRRFIRSEEHTSELQSRFDLVCRLLLEKKKAIMMGVHLLFAETRLNCTPNSSEYLGR